MGLNFNLTEMFQNLHTIPNGDVAGIATEKDRDFFFGNSFLMQDDNIREFMSALCQNSTLNQDQITNLRSSLKSYGAIRSNASSMSNFGVFVMGVYDKLEIPDNVNVESIKELLKTAVSKYVEIGLKDLHRNGTIKIDGLSFTGIDVKDKDKLTNRITSYLMNRKSLTEQKKRELEKDLKDLFNPKGEVKLNLDQIISLLMTANQAVFLGMEATTSFACADMEKILPADFLKTDIVVSTTPTTMTFNASSKWNGIEGSKEMTLAEIKTLMTVDTTKLLPIPSISHADVNYTQMDFDVKLPPVVQYLQDEIEAKRLFGEEGWSQFTNLITTLNYNEKDIEDLLDTMTKQLKSANKECAEAAVSAIIVQINTIKNADTKQQITRFCEQD